MAVGLRADDVVWVLGWYGAIGFDVRTSSGTGLGLDASYHHLPKHRELTLFRNTAKAPSFSTFTAGVHVLFGW